MKIKINTNTQTENERRGTICLFCICLVIKFKNFSKLYIRNQYELKQWFIDRLGLFIYILKPFLGSYIKLHFQTKSIPEIKNGL